MQHSNKSGLVSKKKTDSKETYRHSSV